MTATMNTDNLDEFISTARLAYEAKRAYCAATELLEMPTWNAARGLDRMRHTDFVRLIVSANGHVSEAELARRHDAWVEDMRAAGWRYGEVDFAKRTVPTLCAYDQLPPIWRYRDAIFLAVVLVCIRSDLLRASFALGTVYATEVYDRFREVVEDSPPWASLTDEQRIHWQTIAAISNGGEP